MPPFIHFYGIVRTAFTDFYFIQQNFVNSICSVSSVPCNDWFLQWHDHKYWYCAGVKEDDAKQPEIIGWPKDLDLSWCLGQTTHIDGFGSWSTNKISEWKQWCDESRFTQNTGTRWMTSSWKVKVSLEESINTRRGSRCIAVLFL